MAVKKMEALHIQSYKKLQDPSGSPVTIEVMT